MGAGFRGLWEELWEDVSPHAAHSGCPGPRCHQAHEEQQLHAEKRSTTGRETQGQSVQQIKERKLALSRHAVSSVLRQSLGSSQIETEVPVCTSQPPGYLVTESVSLQFRPLQKCRCSTLRNSPKPITIQRSECWRPVCTYCIHRCMAILHLIKYHSRTHLALF